MVRLFTAPPVRAEPDSPPAPGLAKRPRLVVIVAALILAWLLPVLLAVLRVGALTPFLILLGTASLLRVGRTLLDRLVIAFSILLGALCIAAWGFSFWPWGLDAVPIAGLAFSALVGISLWLRRTPRLPKRGWLDGLCLLVGSVVALAMSVPYRRGDFADRLSLADQDLARHLSIVDVMREIGGYPFLHGPSIYELLHHEMATYPQGWHLTTVVLENFLPSSASAIGEPAFDAVIVAHTLTYGLFALAIMWAALWLGGPLLRAGLRPLLLAAVVLPLVLYSDLTLQYIAGYPSQTLGLVELVILVAVLARPVGRGRTQLVLATALTVAVGYTYYLYLPAALLCGGIWAYARRRDLRRVHLWFLVPIALALVPLGRGLLAGQADRLQFTGSPPMVGRDLVLALFVLVLAGLATKSGRRSPIWRGYLRSTVVVGSSVVAIGLFQLGTAGATGYYFDKMLGAAEVVVLAGLGVVTLLLPAPVRHPRDLRTRVRANTPTALATVALLVLGAGVLHDSSYRSGAPVNWGTEWRKGSYRSAASPPLVLATLETHAIRPDQAVLVLTEDPYLNYVVPLWISALRAKTGGGQSRAQYNEFLPGADATSLTGAILAVRTPLIVFTTTPATSALVRSIQRVHPELPIELYEMPP
jgi:hypothetical protein